MDNRNKGRFGELIVTAKLLEMGIIPSVPVIDVGYDLILDNGKKIQIKTTTKKLRASGNRKKYPAYVFNTWSGGRVGNTSKTIYRVRKFSDSNVDFLICYAIEDRRFYIIPKEEIKTGYNLVVSLSENSKYLRYLEAWDLLRED